MGTEDRILKILEALQQGQERQEKRLDTLQADVKGIKETQQEQGKRLDDTATKDDIERLEDR